MQSEELVAQDVPIQSAQRNHQECKALTSQGMFTKHVHFLHAHFHPEIQNLGKLSEHLCMTFWGGPNET